MTTHDLAIIGAGPAGLTAAVYGLRAGLEVLLLEKTVAGGQMRLTGEIENWPGDPLATGDDLSERMREWAEKAGVAFEDGEVESMAEGPDGTRTIGLIGGGELSAKAVIVASGAYHKPLGCPGVDSFHGRGVSYCAVCDGGFFRGKEVAVVGGGNTALESAIYLTSHAARVHLIHRRGQFRADRVLQDRLAAHPKIGLLMDRVVDEVEGGDSVSGVRLRNVKTGETERLPVSGVFLFVGNAPHSEFLPPQVERIEGGWVVTDRNLQTTWPGVFAAGDVRDTPLRQIVTAAGDGALAAMSAYRYLEGVLGVL
jgi:thioredoxin reductase (NADPH)